MSKNFASTRPVNPPGVEPKITIEQLWAGLGKKARAPKDFVPNVASFAILEDSDDKVVREIVFRNPTGETKITEHITFKAPTSVIFYAAEQNIYVTNLVSFDKENNLQLTFSFVGGIPGVGNTDPGLSLEELSQNAGFAIEKSIANIRGFVKEGVL